MDKKPPKPRKDRPKKRKFQGKQHSKTKKLGTEAIDTPSSKKLTSNLKENVISLKMIESIDGYRLADISSIVQCISSMPSKSCCSMVKKGRCEVCEPSYSVKKTLKGLKSIITFTCDFCDYKFNLDLSPTENVNLRFAYSMYSVGIQHEKSNCFLTYMNMPKSVSTSRHTNYRKKIHTAVSDVARRSMTKAAEV